MWVIYINQLYLVFRCVCVCVRGLLWSVYGRFQRLTYIFITGNGNDAQIWKNAAYTNKTMSVRVKSRNAGMQKYSHVHRVSLMLIIVGTKLQINFNQRGKLAAPRGM